MRLGLWVLFAALVLAGGDLVLRACGTWQVLGFVRNYCPLPPDRRFAGEVADGEGLRRQVHVAEMMLAEQSPCKPDAAPPPTEAEKAPAPEPVVPPTPPTPPTPESKALDEKVEERGGKKGQLQFTLAWETLDDLDLNVVCPGGKISSKQGERGPRTCGDGVKDIDANRNLVENVSSSPVENIVWPTDYPDGEYRLEIIEYRAAGSDGAGNRVPFTLRMRLGDQERECHGEVTQLPESKMVPHDGVTPSGTEQTISWRSGQPLPECTFTELATVRGTGSK